MYSQRNNPYCDLLEIMSKYTTFFEQPSVWRCILQQIVHIFPSQAYNCADFFLRRLIIVQIFLNLWGNGERV